MIIFQVLHRDWIFPNSSKNIGKVYLGDSHELSTTGAGARFTCRERVESRREADVLVDFHAPILRRLRLWALDNAVPVPVTGVERDVKNGRPGEWCGWLWLDGWNVKRIKRTILSQMSMDFWWRTYVSWSCLTICIEIDGNRDAHGCHLQKTSWVDPP